MKDLELMAHNLQQLIKQQPNHQPTDPFQKRQFGRRMRKSTSQVIPPCSLEPRIDHKHTSKMVQSIKVNTQCPSIVQSIDAPELEVYFGEVERAMGKLKVSLPAVEAEYKEHIRRIYMTGSQEQLQSRADELLSNLQGSIEFILRDCLTVNVKPPRDSSLDKENNTRTINQGLMGLPSRRGKQSKMKEIKQQKSIYESILQSRSMKRGSRSGRRMI